ncbi:Virulence protein RhuM family protein [Pollutimonas bauzanensis]|uniref:Virulence protein RhuM family protein n=1 Tax=Pollutimonas bauzanensis TaxID=658167 RepID=A0A1M5VHY8_9BURK|nr:Virulence protein RhuM family protein [Pollutimonas bauzanensis]
MSNSSIALYQSTDGQVRLSVSLDQDTVWLTQRQMAEAFGTTPENVLMHLKNIFADGELGEAATAKDFLVVQTEGKRQVRRRLKHYNLDAIISVGYRVSSARATQFRIWATGVLRQHLVDGYTLNRRRLQERDIEFEQAVSLLARTLANRQLVNDEGRAVLRVIGDYARSWSLLQGYDEQSLTGQNVTQRGMRALDLDAGRWHSISMTLPSHGASAQPIPGPAAAALLNEMPLFHQRPKMLLERVAVAAGQADGFAHGDAAMFARELDNL